MIHNGAYVSFILYLWGSAKSEPVLAFYYSMGIAQNLLIYFLKSYYERTSRAQVFQDLPRTTELPGLQQAHTQQEQLRLAVERGDYGRAAALATVLDREQQRQQQQRGAAAAERLRASATSEIDSEPLTSIISPAGRSGLSCVREETRSTYNQRRRYFHEQSQRGCSISINVGRVLGGAMLARRSSCGGAGGDSNG